MRFYLPAGCALPQASQKAGGKGDREGILVFQEVFFTDERYNHFDLYRQEAGTRFSN